MKQILSWPDGVVVRYKKRKMELLGRKCFICGEIANSRHHLMPTEIRRRQGSQANATTYACIPCHREIHFYVSQWELYYRFNTEQSMRDELLKRKSIKT